MEHKLNEGAFGSWMAYLPGKRTATKVVELNRKPSESSSASAVFRDFVQNTSLLGIQHFLRNKSAVWLFAYLLCVTMSIIQSWSVTVKFFEQNTYQSITIASKTLMPFPSVTVCTGTLLRGDFNFSSIPGFNVKVYQNLLDQCQDPIAMRRMARAHVKNNWAVKRYMRTLREEKRMELGLNLTHLLKECKLGTLRCQISDTGDFHIYSSPFFGNCFTFNPAFDGASAKLVNQSDHLRMTLRFPSGGYWLTMRSNPKMAVHIHPPGTAPIIEDPEVIDVFTNAIATIAVTLESEMLSIKKRLTKIPSCVDSDDETYRRRNMYYMDRSPYIYSQEACLATCTQERYTECGAILPYAPMLSEDRERGKNITYYPDCDMGPVNMEVCDCPIPCNKPQYRFVVDYNDVYNIPCKKDIVPVAMPTPEPDSDAEETGEYENEVSLIIHFRSNIYQKIEEQLSCGISDYLGILGGNLSLWIGLCIISLLELFELLIKVVIVVIRTSRQHS